jgi:hypothetical protein
MEINSDYRDLLQNLNAAGVRYLIVGAYAVMIHTEPRYTKDFDIWIEPEPANAHALYRALAEFGAPVDEIAPEDLAQPDTCYQIGVSPVRIDILTSIGGLEFAGAWERRMIVDFDGVPASVLGRDDILAAKRFAGRPQDKLDVDTLLTPRMKRDPSK